MEVQLLRNAAGVETTDFTKRRRRESAEDEAAAPVGKKTAYVKERPEAPRLNAPGPQPTPELTTYGGIKLGWIQGVLIPCLLNIWGVIIFMRLAWIVGQAGMALTMVIIVVSGFVCVITALSLSAICTNGELQGGGVYYLVSRSLGAELGASVGLMFAFANSVAASMNTIGFCDSLNELLRAHGLRILDNSVNDTRIIGTVALFVMCLICAIGMDWETKTQNFLIVTIVIAIFNYIIGALIGPRNDTQVAQGFVGISLETIRTNMGPDFRFSEEVEHDFFTVFAMYFPAVTGVQAGANICGDLRDPATAIPKGTFAALAISMLSYAALGLLSGAGALRDASGDAGNLTRAALSACVPNCTYGLHNSYEVMQLMSAWAPLIYCGCWAATLSTALTNLLSVPRLVQALGVDRIYPGLIFFSKPYGKHGEPYRGYVLTFFVSLMFLLIADLNTIAPLITNFYLASYALINFCTFHASHISHISWRPTFRYHNMWVSLLGAVLCCGIMLLLSWVMALVTVIAFVVLYLLVLYRHPDADWGSSTEAQRYRSMVEALVHMTQHQHSVKAYNPQVLVLAGPPGRRPGLLYLAHRITLGSYSLAAEICKEKMTRHQREARCASGDAWLERLGMQGFYAVLDGHDLESGARALVQAAGLGRLAPNILLVGYKYDWDAAPDRSLLEYVGVLRLAFEHQLGVTVLRLPGEQRGRHAPPRPSLCALAETRSQALLHVMHEDSDAAPATDDEMNDADAALPPERSVSWLETASAASLSGLSAALAGASAQLVKGEESQFLDAWWLYDDGGLNILLPYVLAYRGAKPGLRMRIYALARHQRDVESAKQQMEMLLAKFRIDYWSLTMLVGVEEPPAPESWALFHELLGKFRHRAHGIDSDCVVAEAELRRQRPRTARQLRLRELLLQHSRAAAFVVMTLPVPRKGAVSAPLYMSWLEVLSRDLPPLLFVRGATSVLTVEA